jgi:hypothetical protein
MREENREARGHCPWQRHAAAYVDGTLSRRKAEEMQKHLCDGCARCAAAVASEKKLRTLFTSAAAAPSEVQMQRVESRVMAAVQSDAITAAKTEYEGRASRLHKWKTVCGVAAMLLLVIGLVRFAPSLLITADNASKEALIGDFNGGAAPDQKSESIMNATGGNKAEAENDADGILEDRVEPTDDDTVAGEGAPPSDAPESVTTQASAAVPTETNAECEEKAAEDENGSYVLYAYTITVNEEDAEAALDILNRVAVENSASVTEVEGGWSTSDALYGALCKELKLSDIKYRTTVAETSVESTQDRRLCLIFARNK